MLDLVKAEPHDKIPIFFFLDQKLDVFFYWIMCGRYITRLNKLAKL